MNPFEEFLRRLFGGGPPPTMQEEEQQAARMPQVARNLPEMARDIGRSFVNAYRQRTQDLQDLAMQQMRGEGIPLSDFGVDPRAAELARAQRDLALDALSAGGAQGMRVGADLLSSAPAVGQSTLRNAAIPWFARSFQDEKDALGEFLRQQFVRVRHPLEGIAQRRDVYHSSQNLFPEAVLDEARQGTGTGDYWQGTGAAYVAEAPSVRDFYRGIAQRASGRTGLSVELPSGQKVSLDALLRKEKELRAAGDVQKADMIANLRGNFNRMLPEEMLRAHEIDFPNASPQEALAQYKDKLAKDRIELKRSQEYLDEYRPQLARQKSLRGRLAQLESDIWDAADKIGRGGMADIRDLTETRKIPEHFTPRQKELGEELLKVISELQPLSRKLKEKIGTSTTISHLESSVRYWKDEIADTQNRYQQTLDFMNPKRTKRIKDPSVPVASYSGFFYANPDELYNLNLPLREQPSGQRIIGALNELPVGQRVLDYDPNMRVGDYLQAQQRNHLDSPNLASSSVNEMILSGQNPNNAWGSYRPEITSASPWEVMQALRGQGIVGNQYLDRYSLERLFRGETGFNPTNNYVVTEPSRLRFASVFGSAPLLPLSSVMSQMQKDKEKKKK